MAVGFLSGTRLKERRSSVVDTQDLNPGLFTLEDANEMITEIKRLHSEERLMQAEHRRSDWYSSCQTSLCTCWAGRPRVCWEN